MKIHIITTDKSAFQLFEAVNFSDDLQITAVIIPSNRHGSDKLDLLKKSAVELGYPVFEHERRSFFPKNLPTADAGVSWLYSQIILPDDIKRYRLGLLNMHGGSIPEYRGASVLHWAIINGESELGITWHEIVEEVDAGPIWAESKISIPPDATAAFMRSQMIEEGIRLFPEAWHNFISPEKTPRYPDLSCGKVWPQRKPGDGFLPNRWPRKKVIDLVRALCKPWPPAFVETEGRKVYIEKVCEENSNGLLPYETSEGDILYLTPQDTKA